MTLESGAMVAPQLQWKGATTQISIPSTFELFIYLISHSNNTMHVHSRIPNAQECIGIWHSRLPIAQNSMFICHLLHTCILFAQEYSYIWYVVLHDCAFALNNCRKCYVCDAFAFILTHRTEFFVYDACAFMLTHCTWSQWYCQFVWFVIRQPIALVT